MQTPTEGPHPIAKVFPNGTINIQRDNVISHQNITLSLLFPCKKTILFYLLIFLTSFTELCGDVVDRLMLLIKNISIFLFSISIFEFQNIMHFGNNLDANTQSQFLLFGDQGTQHLERKERGHSETGNAHELDTSPTQEAVHLSRSTIRLLLFHGKFVTVS